MLAVLNGHAASNRGIRSHPRNEAPGLFRCPFPPPWGECRHSTAAATMASGEVGGIVLLLPVARDSLGLVSTMEVSWYGWVGRIIIRRAYMSGTVLPAPTTAWNETGFQSRPANEAVASIMQARPTLVHCSV